MSDARTITKNTTFLLVGDIIGKILAFFLIVAVARHLGDIGLGKYAFIFAFTDIFLIFSDFGLTVLMVREIAKYKEKTEKYVNNIVVLKFILALVTIILPMIIINFINKSLDVTIAVYIYAFATFFLNFNNLFRALFQAYQKMEYVSLMNIVERIIIVGIGVLILMRGFKVIGLVSVYLFSYIVIFIMAFLISKKFVKIGFQFDIEFWKYLLKNSLPFLFTSIFITIYFRIDSIMLAVMKGYQVVGWYSASYRILDALYFIPITFVTAVFPAMSEFHLKDKVSLSKLYQKSFYYLLSIGLAIAIGTTLLADRIILFIYKEQFINSIITLQILIWAEVMIFIGFLSGFLLNSIDKQKLFTYTTAFCAFVNIILNYILISKYNHIGAAIATLITEILVFVLLFYFVVKNKYGFNFLRFIPKLTVACVGMSLFIVYFKFLHLLVLIPIAGIIYYGILFLIKGMGEDEINMIKSLIKKH